MRVRLERLRIEGNDAPMDFDAVRMYLFDFTYDEADPPTMKPIEVEECGSDHVGRLWVIRDGRHRYVAAMLAGRKDILAFYKGEQWTPSTKGSSPTLAAVQSSPSESSD